MILAKVVGNVTATIKHPSYEGHKNMLVQPVDENGKEIGSPFLSFDNANSGSGDYVLVEQEGNCARQLLGTKDDPFHSVIVGVVDTVATIKV